MTRCQGPLIEHSSPLWRKPNFVMSSVESGLRAVTGGQVGPANVVTSVL